MEHAASAEKLDMYQNPICMRANADIMAGGLTLVAAGTEISDKEGAKSVGLGYFMMQNGSREDMYVMAKVILPMDKSGAMSAHSFVAPFWHNALVGEANDANMELTWEVSDVAGYEVMPPPAINTKEIKKGDMVARLKPKGTLGPPERAPQAQRSPVQGGI